MEFKEAIKLLEKGKKIKRPDFDKDEFISLYQGTIPKYYNRNTQSVEYFHFDIMDFKANDWEEYTEK